jgi:RNA polymerase sigma-70 factor (ECF subfamily)
MLPTSSQLGSNYEQGLAAWPGVSLTYEAFCKRLDSLAVAASDLAARAGDLVLAFACAELDAVALRAFDAAYLSLIPRYIARFDLSAHLGAEVGQRVRMKLLLGQPPGIARYRGHGPLAAWVRVSAVRVAIDVASTAWSGDELDDKKLGLVESLADNPEIATLKNAYREQLTTAIEETLAALGLRDRTLLRLQVVDGLGIDAIAGIYGIHRATAARWLGAVRARIFQELRDRLTPFTAASTGELRSIVRLLGHELRVSAAEILGAER